MALLIQDEEVIRELEQIAADSGVSPIEALKNAVHELAGRSAVIEPRRRRSPEEIDQAVSKIQEAYQRYGDPKDRRTPDEVIGYNELGHFD